MPTLSLEPVVVPLRRDAGGTIRAGNSRVLLELVVRAFRNGATPEAIVMAYDSLNLRDVYAVLAYCLAHEADIDEYLLQCDQEADAVRNMIETAQPKDLNLRDRLLARLRAKEAQEKNGASASQ